ncbi:hypothetical protein [Hugenholtzia roseola]|uniref:hypothetical protein n=1 Tax=Hugenholtzia roseola TaxID=1002 RepID=UPI00047BB2B0|nr:hypothetical protein [Hugenholtzia roseola]
MKTIFYFACLTFGLVFLLSSFAKPTQPQDGGSYRLSLQDLMQIHKSRNPQNIDAQITDRKWIYISSEKEGKNQIDMWSYEVYYHQVRAMLLNIFSSESGIQNNQTQLHLFHKEDSEQLISELEGAQFKKVREKIENNQTYLRYQNEEFVVFILIDASQTLPYRFTLASLK